MRARLLLLASLVPIAAAALVSTAVAGDPGAQVQPAQLVGVTFITSCPFSHRAPDDPIVFPGRAGASHDHTFVGNRSTNAFSSLASLLAAGTTCSRSGDTAAYWMPTLNVGGQPVMPLSATIYYRRRSVSRVDAFPPGFRMIAGSSKATSPQPKHVAFWNCRGAPTVAVSSTPPTCPDARGNGLQLQVHFPSCWDGRTLDSSDHQSHVHYQFRGNCPSRYPRPLPAISLVYRYPTTGGAGVSLASGGVYSAHADFFNAWQQGDLQRLVDSCLNALRHCGKGE